MTEKVKKTNGRTSRRTLGVHLTSTDTFLEYIFPEIAGELNNHIWVDLYCGEGNLILPILDSISKEKRDDFFSNNIFLYDIQLEMVNKCIKKAVSYGISEEIAKQNIKQRDNLKNYPKELLQKGLSIYHITNPPYLYLGYIRKHKETERHLEYFENENIGYQDLYQIAMINDLRNNIENLIYIIPSNFLFGAAVSNKFRMDFLNFYDIIKMYVFETQIFEFTGTNICIGFFQRKKKPEQSNIQFEGIKIKKKNEVLNITYTLKPEWKYRAGADFDDFTQDYKTKKPLIVKYYLLNKEVENNQGNQAISVIDSNAYISNEYKSLNLKVNEKLKTSVLSNILYVRTVDTGSYEGRAGLYEIKEDFNVDGIYVSKATYRTSPIQIFLEPTLSFNDQILLKMYFNFILEYFRKTVDSGFMTTYKYSKAEYTRKYLGLTQVRKLIQTFPILDLKKEEKKDLIDHIKSKDFKGILSLMKRENVKKENNNKISSPTIDLTKWF
jgi:hypothetical protein